MQYLSLKNMGWLMLSLFVVVIQMSAAVAEAGDHYIPVYFHVHSVSNLDDLLLKTPEIRSAPVVVHKFEDGTLLIKGFLFLSRTRFRGAHNPDYEAIEGQFSIFKRGPRLIDFHIERRSDFVIGGEGLRFDVAGLEASLIRRLTKIRAERKCRRLLAAHLRISK